MRQISSKAAPTYGSLLLKDAGDSWAKLGWFKDKFYLFTGRCHTEKYDKVYQLEDWVELVTTFKDLEERGYQEVHHSESVITHEHEDPSENTFYVLPTLERWISGWEGEHGAKEDRYFHLKPREIQRILEDIPVIKGMFKEKVLVSPDYVTWTTSAGRLVTYHKSYSVWPAKGTSLKSWLEWASKELYGSNRCISVEFQVEETDGRKPVVCKWGAPVMMDCRVESPGKTIIKISTHYTEEIWKLIPEHFLK